MKVSVSILAYNHERFIADSIESALNQKTNFDFEILIGEDKSSDRTREIVREYERKYPDIIKVAYNEYPADYKRSNAWDNFYQNFARAKGEYVAYMDGDDYWIDNNKLQKQADILDANPDYILTHTNAEYRSTNGELAGVRHQNGTKEIIDAFDMINVNFILTSSCMYRNVFKGEFPDYMNHIHTIDRYFNIYHLMHGKGYYLNDVTCVYRYDSGGIYNSLSKIKRTENRLTDMKLILKSMPEEYHFAIKKYISSQSKQLLKLKIKRLLGM